MRRRNAEFSGKLKAHAQTEEEVYYPIAILIGEYIKQIVGRADFLIMADFEQTRPTFFSILRIAFPVGAVTSIAHRVSGIVLALCTPVAIYLLDVSLHSAENYEWVRALLDTLPAKALALVAVWAFAHHFFAGIRHLLMDIDVGSSLPAARLSAWLVNIAGVAVSLVAVGMLP